MHRETEKDNVLYVLSVHDFKFHGAEIYKYTSRNIGQYMYCMQRVLSWGRTHRYCFLTYYPHVLHFPLTVQPQAGTGAPVGVNVFVCLYVLAL